MVPRRAAKWNGAIAGSELGHFVSCDDLPHASSGNWQGLVNRRRVQEPPTDGMIKSPCRPFSARIVAQSSTDLWSRASRSMSLARSRAIALEPRDPSAGVAVVFAPWTSQEDAFAARSRPAAASSAMAPSRSSSWSSRRRRDYLSTDSARRRPSRRRSAGAGRPAFRPSVAPAVVHDHARVLPAQGGAWR